MKSELACIFRSGCKNKERCDLTHHCTGNAVTADAAELVPVYPPLLTPSHVATSKPRGAYVPLTEEQIEEWRALWKEAPKFVDDVIDAEEQRELNVLCDMAINSLLYAEEIHRLRGVAPSATALNDLPSPYRKLLAVEDRDAHHRECQRQDSMFAHQLANMGGLLNEALEIIDSVGPSALGDRIRYFREHGRPKP